MSSELLMSEMKSDKLIAARRRKERGMGGGVGGDLTLRRVKMGKWSEGDSRGQETDGFSIDSEAVMTRSRMWFCE